MKSMKFDILIFRRSAIITHTGTECEFELQHVCVSCSRPSRDFIWQRILLHMTDCRQNETWICRLSEERQEGFVYAPLWHGAHSVGLHIVARPGTGYSWWKWWSSGLCQTWRRSGGRSDITEHNNQSALALFPPHTESFNNTGSFKTLTQ